ncbi:hypothetical protein D8674_000466 [Pyrus ussuriensis x Pyrus communis]|uniref:Uncharacterized protein n=1 Tax=Pyrus ussuriensis x Pyrus communis TaxID=2448454 RepID=A0A5N5F3H4_9ROSA|nr:hypothetical protein D8674_000466 [Pyrus ussuriensis x Pyrus communis]
MTKKYNCITTENELSNVSIIHGDNLIISEEAEVEMEEEELLLILSVSAILVY